MTPDQLRYVVGLNKYGTMQRAATALHISKPGLSKAISQLENELGIKLFNRSVNGTQLTNQGQALLPLMRQELDINFRILQSAARLKTAPDGQIVKVGYSGSLLAPISEEYLKLQNNNNDQAGVEISQQSPREMIQLLEEQKIDISFLDADQEVVQMENRLSFHQIHSGRLGLFVRQDHPLTKVTQIEPEELKKQKFVLIDEPSVERSFNELQDLCGHFNVIVKNDNYQVACNAVRQLDAVMLACGLVVVNSVDDFETQGITSINIPHLLNSIFSFGWLVNPNSQLSLPTQNMVNNICQTIIARAKHAEAVLLQTTRPVI